MAIGRSFRESLQKALRSMEIGASGLDSPLGKRPQDLYDEGALDEIRARLRRPAAERIIWVAEAFRAGLAPEEVHELSGIDPIFLDGILELVEEEARIAREGLGDGERLRELK